MTQAERIWRGLPPWPEEASQSTVEALMFSLRERGVAVLAETNCQSRLSELSPAQVRQVIECLDCLRSKYPLVTDNLLLNLADLIP